MAHASPFAMPARLRLYAMALVAVLSAGAATAQPAERFGPFAVAQEPQRLMMSDATRPTVRLAWTSEDKRLEVSLLDTGVVLLTQLRARDAAGKVRCATNGPLLAYDNRDWMELRWRTLIEEQGNFLRTCHAADRRMAGAYRKQFLRDAAGFAAPLGALKREADAAFGADRARCLDIADGKDAATAPRSACEAMVARP